MKTGTVRRKEAAKKQKRAARRMPGQKRKKVK
jgi:hypothetical protein